MATLQNVPSSLYPLQGLVLPEPGLAPDEELFFQRSGALSYSLSRQEFSCRGGADLGFETWFNLFNRRKWQDTQIGHLYLQIVGQGRFELRLSGCARGRSKETVYQERVDIEGDLVLPLDGFSCDILTVSLTCLSDSGTLKDVLWMTDRAPPNAVDAMVVIPTFQREAQVARLAEKFLTWRAASGHPLQLCIVDNGGGTVGTDLQGVTVVPSENFGGSGGFAKGLIHAQDAGASHCLFMDDDADFHPESLSRALTYLRYVDDPNAAISGAMIATENRRAIWENGASFFQFCTPQHWGTSLTSLEESVDMETLSARPQSADMYGGWWFFAFPISAARHLPFPFFLRGDDVSFSLANPFSIRRLNGVAAYQEGFTAKESPRSWYLDIRSHLTHHLTQPELQISAFSMLKIVLFFLGQTSLRMHYGSARAVLLGMRDVMRGPSFFAQNANLETRLAQVDKAGICEGWGPISTEQPVTSKRSKWGTFWMMLGNGTLLPGFRFWGRKVTIRAQDRRDLSLIWGAAEVTVLHNTQPFAYRVRHSKFSALIIGLSFLGLALRFLLTYRGLRRHYQRSYAGLTSRTYWERVFTKAEVAS